MSLFNVSGDRRCGKLEKLHHRSLCSSCKMLLHPFHVELELSRVDRMVADLRLCVLSGMLKSMQKNKCMVRKGLGGDGMYSGKAFFASDTMAYFACEGTKTTQTSTISLQFFSFIYLMGDFSLFVVCFTLLCSLSIAYLSFRHVVHLSHQSR